MYDFLDGTDGKSDQGESNIARGNESLSKGRANVVALFLFMPSRIETAKFAGGTKLVSQ